MIALSVNNIKKSFGVDPVIQDISFTLNEGERVGLVGINGTGKSTLFKIAAGIIEADSGEIFIGKGLKVGYLEQNPDLFSQNSVLDEVLTVFEELKAQEEELRSLEHEIALESSDPHSKVLKSLMDEYSHKMEEFNKNNGYAYNSEAKGVLRGLGFSEEELSKPVNVLSGGEKTRVALSKLLLKKPDVLLLDEPTNHLDTDSIEWLEGYLKQYKGTLLMISHDRYFLDQLVTRIFEIHNQTLYSYNGNYSAFVIQREENEEIETRKYENYQDEVKRQEEIIRQLKSFGREKSVKRARSREKLLDKMETVERPRFLRKKARMTFSLKKATGYDVLHVKNLSKSFGDRSLFSELELNIYRGEKVALIGPNGVGKTTLFNILMGRDSEYDGELKFGANVETTYFDQERGDLDTENMVLDEIWDEYPNLTEREVRTYLGAFLFQGEDVFKEISSLSGGEKARISLLKMMLSNSNFLFMDEPTNHLDIDSKEVLEAAIQDYEGTVFFISHDRYFLNQVATKIILLTPEGISEYLGNYDYYLEKRAQLKEDQEAIRQKPEEKTKTQLKDEKKKEREKREEERKVKREREKIETSITELEEQLATIDELLCQEEVYSNPEKSKEVSLQKQDIEKELEFLYEKWEEVL